MIESCWILFARLHAGDMNKAWRRESRTSRRLLQLIGLLNQRCCQRFRNLLRLYRFPIPSSYLREVAHQRQDSRTWLVDLGKIPTNIWLIPTNGDFTYMTLQPLLSWKFASGSRHIWIGKRNMSSASRRTWLCGDACGVDPGISTSQRVHSKRRKHRVPSPWCVWSLNLLKRPSPVKKRERLQQCARKQHKIGITLIYHWFTNWLMTLKLRKNIELLGLCLWCSYSLKVGA